MTKQFLLVALAAVVALGGCHSFKKENIQPPTPLAKDFTPSVKVTRLWQANVGDGAGMSGVRLSPAVENGVLYAAGTDGKLVALDATSGKTLWSRNAKSADWLGESDKKLRDGRFAGGPVVSGGLLVIGTLDGHVYGLDAGDGTLRWKTDLKSQVLAAPVIDGDLVVVRSSDGRVYGLDAGNGERRWAYDQDSVPLLSLRGNGSLLLANGVVFFGSDDGRLVALRQDNGNKLWDLRLASGEGRTEIDRLNDADGAVLLDGSTLYAAAYHGNLTAVDGPSGRPLWSHAFSTYGGLAISHNALYGIDDESRVWSFDKSTGTDLWKNTALQYRWLSAPAVQGSYVVAGDLDGWVHWLQTGDGALAARVRLSKKAIRARPVVANDVVYVEDVEGRIGAYRLATP